MSSWSCHSLSFGICWSLFYRAWFFRYFVDLCDEFFPKLLFITRRLSWFPLLLSGDFCFVSFFSFFRWWSCFPFTLSSFPFDFGPHGFRFEFLISDFKSALMAIFRPISSLVLPWTKIILLVLPFGSVVSVSSRDKK